MKSPAGFAIALSLFSSVIAHEGHSHASGIGHVISTATVTGSDGHEYVTVPGWGAMPNEQYIGPLHGDLAVVKSGGVYVSLESQAGIAVFDRHGKFMKTLKPGLQELHSLIAVEEDGNEFLWGAQAKQNRAVKFDLEGNIVATLPNEKTGKLEGGMDGLAEVLVGPEGHVYFFMGYGSNKIHKLKPDGTLVKTYGGKGTGNDQFTACHGAAMDYRYDEPRILVCDRDGRRMIHLTLDLTWIGIYGATPMRRPADVDVQGEYAAVSEIKGRVILMDKEGKLVAALLDNPDQKQWATNGVPAYQLRDSAFSAPHGIKWGPQGQIYVSECSKVGRLVALYPKK
ncbi:hypothetical protein N9A94_03715 [Akkermansiaceae bacterium]|nr:hypothetical protein [Akkermansiaceae bacterium]MDA7887799.1 hypothetical protein [Akkermansiaceae bacterium]